MRSHLAYSCVSLSGQYPREDFLQYAPVHVMPEAIRPVQHAADQLYSREAICEYHSIVFDFASKTSKLADSTGCLQADPELHDHIQAAEMPPYFALGWFITWFSHSVQQLDQVLVGHVMHRVVQCCQLSS